MLLPQLKQTIASTYTLYVGTQSRTRGAACGMQVAGSNGGDAWCVEVVVLGGKSAESGGKFENVFTMLPSFGR